MAQQLLRASMALHLYRGQGLGEEVINGSGLGFISSDTDSFKFLIPYLPLQSHSIAHCSTLWILITTKVVTGHTQADSEYAGRATSWIGSWKPRVGSLRISSKLQPEFKRNGWGYNFYRWRLHALGDLTFQP
jgi:hypothetical protein